MAAFSQHEIDALGARAEAMVNALGTISAEPNRLVRLFLTAEHRRAADRVAEWMRAAGLTVNEDALGTVRGRLEGLVSPLWSRAAGGCRLDRDLGSAIQAAGFTIETVEHHGIRPVPFLPALTHIRGTALRPCSAAVGECGEVVR